MPVAVDFYYSVCEGSEEGLRPPVVLIHGAGGTHLYWPAEMRRLPGYRMYALDLPGHGKSGGRGQQSIPAYAQAVLEWLEAVGLHKAAASMGHTSTQTTLIYNRRSMESMLGEVTHNLTNAYRSYET